MYSPVTIIPLFNEHSEQIIDIILPIQQIEFNIPITLEDQPDLLDIEKFYHGAGGGFWGAFFQGELVGSIALIATGNQAGAIRKMFVRKEYRGRETAVAQLLLEALITYSREQGITDLYLGTVEVLKAAHRFYERNGFVRIEKEDLPSYFPRMRNDNIFYHLPLN